MRWAWKFGAWQSTHATCRSFALLFPSTTQGVPVQTTKTQGSVRIVAQVDRTLVTVCPVRVYSPLKVPVSDPDLATSLWFLFRSLLAESSGELTIPQNTRFVRPTVALSRPVSKARQFFPAQAVASTDYSRYAIFSTTHNDLELQGFSLHIDKPSNMIAWLSLDV